MERVILYTRDGRAVTTIEMPPFILPAEGVLWGERTFFRRPDGKYYEGLLWIDVKSVYALRGVGQDLKSPPANVEVYTRPECPYAYCDSPAACSAANGCHHGQKAEPPRE